MSCIGIFKRHQSTHGTRFIRESALIQIAHLLVLRSINAIIIFGRKHHRGEHMLFPAVGPACKAMFQDTQLGGRINEANIVHIHGIRDKY